MTEKEGGKLTAESFHAAFIQVLPTVVASLLLCVRQYAVRLADVFELLLFHLLHFFRRTGMSVCTRTYPCCAPPRLVNFWYGIVEFNVPLDTV